MRHELAVAVALGILTASAAPFAGAQATRTWVSGTGSDANTCARTAPCQTFAGALGKTTVGGEISVLDAGGFGTVTITKSITINGTGSLAGILSSGTIAVVVSITSATDPGIVILRNLEIQGAGNGLDGVRFLSGKQLVIENTRISGVTRFGVFVAPMPAGRAGSVVIRNSTIAGAGDGIRVQFGTTNVSNSIVTGAAGNALFAESGGIINAESNRLVYNGVAVRSAPGSTVRISNNDIFANTSEFECGGGTIATDMSNRTAASGAGCAPNGTIVKR